MRELHDVVASLLDADGSCRDVNFERPTWVGVEHLIDRLKRSFASGSATDQDGHTHSHPDPVAVSAAARAGGYVHLVFAGGVGLLKQLQVFVACEEDGTPFVELTFFPWDIAATLDLRRTFLEWADEMRTQLGARRYYARYENASWRFGDIGPTSGVFFVSDAMEREA